MKLPHVELINVGKNSETVSGLSEHGHPGVRPCIHNHLESVLFKSHPDMTFICYGMNDGIYHPFSKERFEAYKSGMIKLIEMVKNFGSKVVLMTPPPFEKYSFKSVKDGLKGEGCQSYSYIEPFTEYNEVIKEYSK